MMRIVKFRLVLLVIFFVVSFTLSAQPGNPQTTDPDEGVVPITGIEWLIAGGCVLGLKRFLGFRKLSSKE
jgi:hypothetical protein